MQVQILSSPLRGIAKQPIDHHAMAVDWCPRTVANGDPKGLWVQIPVMASASPECRSNGLA